MPYVLGKVKRTVAGQRVADVADLDGANLTGIAIDLNGNITITGEAADRAAVSQAFKEFTAAEKTKLTGIDTGAKKVVANPAGTGGDALTRITIGTENFVFQTSGAASDPVRIVNNQAFTDWGNAVAVADWRNYDILVFALNDTDDTDNKFQAFILTAQLNLQNRARVSVENNAGILLTTTAGSDNITLALDPTNATVDGFPDAGDTIDVWGIQVAAGPQGGKGDKGDAGTIGSFIATQFIRSAATPANPGTQFTFGAGGALTAASTGWNTANPSGTSRLWGAVALQLSDGTKSVSAAFPLTGTAGTNGTNGTAGTNGTNGTNGTDGSDAENNLQHNVATSDPGTGNDSDDGYSQGSIWVNTATKTLFFCTNAAAGAAVWVDVSGSASPLSLAAVGDKEYVEDTAISALTLPVATGGDGTYTYAATGLPDGLAFAASTRIISGTPTAPGTSTVTYTVTDGDSNSVERQFGIEIIHAGRRRIALAADSSFDATELEAGNDYASNVGTLVLPNWTGSLFIAIAQPSSLDDLTSIQLGGGGNSIDDFEKQSGTVTIASVSHDVWVSKQHQGNVIQGFSVMVD